MNRVYRIDLDIKGTIEILAESEEAARAEAEAVIRYVTQSAAVGGLYLREPEIKPRLVLERGQG